jgi:hypothetical protein
VGVLLPLVVLGVLEVLPDSLPARRARCGLSSSAGIAVSWLFDVITGKFAEGFSRGVGTADGNTNVP